MKLLLIGWDAADASVIEPLLERGLMPCLEHFCSKASSGGLQPIRPWDSAALWTTIATGKRATDHGVVNAVEVDPTRTQIQTTSRWACTARPIWSVLSEAGYRTHALGWPASHPAEPINGISVSNQFSDYGESNSVHPPRHQDTLRALRLSPRDIDAPSLASLAPRAAELDPITDRRLYSIARFLASTASIHAAATWALENEPWDFAAVRYAGLEELVRTFGPSFAATQAGHRSTDAELFGDLIPNAYRFFDMLLARLLELAGPPTSVMLVSQQGWTPRSSVAGAVPCRPTPGMLIAGGPAFLSCRQVPHASVCDVAPTILYLFGISPEPGTDGCALRDMLSKTADAAIFAPDADRTIDQPIDLVDGSPETRKSDTGPPTTEDYKTGLNAPEDHEQRNNSVPLAIKQLELELQRRLAEACSDAGEYDRAVRILEALVQIEPTSIQFRTALAEANFLAGKYDACRKLIKSLQTDGIDSPLSETGLAATDVREGRHASALEHLRRAEAMDGASAEVLELIGRAYLRLRRPTDAARALDRAITIDPSQASVHDGRAIACLLAGNAISAERHAREAVELSPQSYEARYHLGLALARQSRLDEAIDVLRSAVAIDRRGRGASAHRHLANLLERRGDHAMALHHRAQSHREDTTR